ncbi:LysR family transcriptional regulator [Paracoccus caeni]|uniref:LysR family transcriptional regulator n=1 Tax=Paracoccus caeni TaxID=657651 RepID=A0A934W1B3_9RHOB|nr:LysR family transcriptional regulator [Paracoccus caeni]MBK4216629.1 LysR family transcriptional regulator [Paracoccus caeni]
MQIDNWDDIRVALAVARAGTVSGAAELLGVHHATVIRRIDALEEQLGARLFQRHPRGYALTEAGQVLLKTGVEATERFAQMASQIHGTGDRIEGELIVTSLAELDDLVIPRLVALMRDHPALRLTYLTDPRLFRLDVGEAHIAIRAGNRPTEPDYVVQHFRHDTHSLYASPEYLARYGEVKGVTGHRFALNGVEGRNAPYMRWLAERLRPENIVMVASESAAREAVIRAGLAIGVLPRSRTAGLVKLDWPQEWDSQLWLVTHVDLHRTPKVQAALRMLRAE